MSTSLFPYSSCCEASASGATASSSSDQLAVPPSGARSSPSSDVLAVPQSCHAGRTVAQESPQETKLRRENACPAEQFWRIKGISFRAGSPMTTQQAFNRVREVVNRKTHWLLENYREEIVFKHCPGAAHWMSPMRQWIISYSSRQYNNAGP